MIKLFTGLFCLFLCAGAVTAQVIPLKKVKLEKNITASYNYSQLEYYQVGDNPDEGGDGEWARTIIESEITQDILVKKKNYIQVDYSQHNFTRNDAIAKSKDATDTSSNRGKSPLIKIILQHTGNGKFLGPVMDVPTPIYNQRDFKYFYNTCKQMVLHISDSCKGKTKWSTAHSDTISTLGFELLFNYELKWETVGMLDTLGYKCMKLKYESGPQDYYGVNSVMKALGIETVHTGFGGVTGSIYFEVTSGRIILLKEIGVFFGEMTMNTPGEVIKRPSQYHYTKQFVLTNLVKKKRKKFLGIF